MPISTNTKRFLLTFLLLNSSGSASAQIIADPNAPGDHQPQVLLSSEQLSQVVDIQAPSPAGVSMNEYQQFDVGREGAILNNHIDGVIGRPPAGSASTMTAASTPTGPRLGQPPPAMLVCCWPGKRFG